MPVRAKASCGSRADSRSRIRASAFPEQALQKLGRPFEQVESHISKSHTGSGLGLAIAKSLVELHGGQMRIRSIESVGTTVILRVPLAGPAAHLARGGGLTPSPIRSVRD